MESNTTTGREQAASRSPGSLGHSPAASATQRAQQEPRQVANELLDKGAQAAGQAYSQVSEAVNETVQQAADYGKQVVSYSRENPGKTALIALGAGIGIGVVIASSFNSRNRSSRIITPIVEALTVVALEIFR